MRLDVLTLAFCLAFVGLSTSAATDARVRQPTNIAAQELAPALQTLAKERDVQVVYRSEIVVDHWTGGASGNLTLEEALLQLLDATGLTYRFLAEKAITIIPIDDSSRVGQLPAEEAGVHGKGRSR